MGVKTGTDVRRCCEQREQAGWPAYDATVANATMNLQRNLVGPHCPRTAHTATRSPPLSLCQATRRVQVEPSRVESSRVESEQIESSQVKTSQVKSKQIKSKQIKSKHVK